VEDEPAGPAAVVAALQRRRDPADVVPGPLPASWSLRRHRSRSPLVSLIIPFRDGARLLRTCVDSIRATAAELDLEFVLVDNGSAEAETKTLTESLAGEPGVVVLTDPRPFNWAALNNGAADQARGEVLVFLNNDIEARQPGWLSQLSQQAVRPGVAAVGARLLYPTGQVQHAGVVVGMGGAAGHVLAGLAAERPGYLGMAALTRNVSAVTGACLAVERARFFELGRFDESLGIDLNDVDFCLRAIEAGYRVVYEPLAELVHHESPSRGTSGSVKNITRFVDRWQAQLEIGDRYLNTNLTRMDATCALRGPDEARWWKDWRQLLDV
jgi:O-antigen biosynthesis protein